MSGDLQFMKDILLQMQTEQVNQGKVLAEIQGTVKPGGSLDTRVASLEGSRKTNFWITYVVTPLVGIAHGIAAWKGVKI